MKIAMITGDHPATATAIAREVGLIGDPPVVVEGRDLPDDVEVLGALVDRDGIVLARIDPEHKLLIAQRAPWTRARCRDDRRRRERRTRSPRSEHRDRDGWCGHRRCPGSRRPRAPRRRLRNHRRRSRAGPRDVRQHPAVPHLPPHRQRCRAHALRHLGTLGRAVPSRPGRVADPRARHRHRHVAGRRTGRGTRRTTERSSTRPRPATYSIESSPAVCSASSVCPRRSWQWLPSSRRSSPPAGDQDPRSRPDPRWPPRRELRSLP